MTSPYSAKASQDKDEKWLLEEKYAGKETAEYKADKKRLASGEPLAYVIGWQPFLGLKIFLDSKPLIPRPETEWWTEQMLTNLEVQLPSGSRASKLRFLDLCAGSGAIGCAALKTLPYMEVSFGEIDPAHKQTILKNIRENGLDEFRAGIRVGDLFEPFGDSKFDVIAINPPYIPADRALPESVAKHEPVRALCAGGDGLDIIRRIAAELPQYLAPSTACHPTNRVGGVAWIECDTAHAAAACALFSAQGLSAEIRTDQFDMPRVIVVSFP